MALVSPAENLSSLGSEDALTAGAIGFMLRLFVLTTLPHSRPEGYCFERVNGRHTLRMSAPRNIGLPYGSYPRLLLAYLTTQAVRTKSPQIDLGATTNGLARNLGLSTISGPRGTTPRLQEQLHRLLHMRLEWQTSLSLEPRLSGSAFVTPSGPLRLKLLRRLLPTRPSWRSKIVLGQDFLDEITSSAVPVDLQAIRHLQRSPLAIDLYVWLTYRMSYLRKPTVVPWKSLEAQFGSVYARLQDLRSQAVTQLEKVIRVYPKVRVTSRDTGLRLYPSPPHAGHAQVPTSRLVNRTIALDGTAVGAELHEGLFTADRSSTCQPT